MRHLRRSLAAVLSLMATTQAQAKAPPDPHRLWAYPRGVIVTSDGGRVDPPPRKDDPKPSPEAGTKTTEGPTPPPSEAELRTLSRQLVQTFQSCLEAQRAQTAAFQTSGARYSFSLDFFISPSGRVTDFTLTKNPGSANLPACADNLIHTMETHAFAAPPEQVQLGAHANYDAVILTDDEAKGHGYLYYEAETRWETALKHNTAWFSCKLATDCTITAELCEVRAVNTTALPAYRQAIGERKKPTCRRSIDLSTYTVRCRAGRCSAHGS